MGRLWEAIDPAFCKGVEEVAADERSLCCIRRGVHSEVRKDIYQKRAILSDPPEMSNFKLGMTNNVFTKSLCASLVTEICCFVSRRIYLGSAQVCRKSGTYFCIPYPDALRGRMSAALRHQVEQVLPGPRNPRSRFSGHCYLPPYRQKQWMSQVQCGP